VFSNRAASLMYGSTGPTENIWTRVVGLLMLSAFLFLIVYMLSKELSKYKAFRPIKKLINQDLEANLRLEVDAIDQKASKIVNDSILKDSKIP
ncbi:LPXTG cell wall anchor domain-containing protein, partial [Leuconostoc suionicum]|uniref:LPXTG cell wall anchor domain-containing protein n=2 Tax=Leuconostoc TaxID=1243 RepID=UPI00300CD94E